MLDAPNEETVALRAQLARSQSQLAASEAERRRLEQELAELSDAQRAVSAELKAQSNEYTTWPDAMNMMATFEAIDDNHDGVLTKEEFRNGYALIREREVEKIFDTFDDNHDGVLTRDEFAKGYTLLREDQSAQAAAEREKVAVAVANERVRATKEAARNLAEAQLMDALFVGPTAGKGGGGGEGGKGAPPRRQPNSRQPFRMQGTPPKGFDVEAARSLVAERTDAKSRHEYEKAEQLQAQLGAMGIKLDDRYRTWTFKSAAGRGRARNGRGGGRGSARRGGGNAAAAPVIADVVVEY